MSETSFEEKANMAAQMHDRSCRSAFEAGALWAKAELQGKMNAIWCERSLIDDANIDLNCKIQELHAEVTRLKRIIAQELTENDELGSEYTYVTVLKEKLALAYEALEFYAKNTMGPYHSPADGDYMSVVNDGGKTARQALAKTKGE